MVAEGVLGGNILPVCEDMPDMNESKCLSKYNYVLLCYIVHSCNSHSYSDPKMWSFTGV